MYLSTGINITVKLGPAISINNKHSIHRIVQCIVYLYYLNKIYIFFTVLKRERAARFYCVVL